MTSWWRRVAEELGATGPARSWKQRIARHLGVTKPGRSHLGRISTVKKPRHRNSGSWAARMTPPKAPASMTWAGRIFFNKGVLGPPGDKPGGPPTTGNLRQKELD